MFERLEIEHDWKGFDDRGLAFLGKAKFTLDVPWKNKAEPVGLGRFVTVSESWSFEISVVPVPRSIAPMPLELRQP